MPCCLAEKYKWCKDLPVVAHKDEEGKEYCIFHAPHDKKGVSDEEFNKLIFERIHYTKSKNDFCSLSGTIFKDNIIFSQVGVLTSLPPIDFSWCEFNGETGFSNVLFGREAYFSHAKFCKGADFKKALFNGNANFEEAALIERANFSDAEFKEVVTFSNVKFRGYATFNKAKFSKGVSFVNAKFIDAANFWDTKFSREVEFSYAEFNKVADFTRTEFKKEASFSFATFNDIAYFYKAIFQRASFYAAIFNERTYFYGETFIEGGNFRSLAIKETIRFESANLKKISFLDTNLRKMDFINCGWHKRFGRDVLYDELSLYTDDKKAKNSFQPKEKTKKIEILYRQLKQKYKEEHNEPEVSNWHYGEKEMFRKGSRRIRFNPASLSNLYWLSSGYGERPVRAGNVLLLLILTLSVLFGSAGLEPNPSLNGNPAYEINKIKSLSDMLSHLWGIILNTLQYATFEKVPDYVPKTIYGATLKFVVKILIPLQAALFALAIRNRFRR